MSGKRPCLCGLSGFARRAILRLRDAVLSFL